MKNSKQKVVFGQKRIDDPFSRGMGSGGSFKSPRGGNPNPFLGSKMGSEPMQDSGSTVGSWGVGGSFEGKQQQPQSASFFAQGSPSSPFAWPSFSFANKDKQSVSASFAIKEQKLFSSSFAQPSSSFVTPLPFEFKKEGVVSFAPPPSAPKMEFAPPLHSPPPPPRARPAPVSKLSLQQRLEQECLFTPSCRRDVYRVLCATPGKPLRAASVAPPTNFPASPPLLGAVKIGMEVPQGEGGSPSIVLVRRDSNTSNEDVMRLVKLIEEVGKPNMVGIAFTEAFERVLANEYAPFWTDEDSAKLSVPFSVAFGNELSPRLDIAHVIRSREMRREEVEWAKSIPGMRPYLEMLEIFQGE